MYSIGVDLGGTNIAVGLVDENYKIVQKISTPTLAGRPAEEIVGDISKLCKKLMEAKGLAPEDVKTLGIASPGSVDAKTGVVVYSNNLRFHDLPIAKLVSEQTGIKNVIVENDANAAALGEAVAGAAKDVPNSIMITLGTGVGGGIIIDNKLYTGLKGAGAELGHTVIEFGGRQCSCGRRGCWEAYSSATAVINMTKEKIAECEKSGRKTIMTDLVSKKGKVSGVTAFDAMRAGDEAGREVVDTYLDYLACGLANMVNIFRPDVISLGGGISNEGQSLIDALLPRIRKEQYGGENSHSQVEIRIAKLGNDAGIIGAAALEK